MRWTFINVFFEPVAQKKNEILEVFLKISVLCPQQNLFYKLLVGQAPSFDETCSKKTLSISPLEWVAVDKYSHVFNIKLVKLTNFKKTSSVSCSLLWLLRPTERLIICFLNIIFLCTLYNLQNLQVFSWSMSVFLYKKLFSLNIVISY